MNMIEKVAKAIYDLSPMLNNYCTDTILWENLQGLVKDLCFEQARAAIEAMREPTDEMIIAGYGDEYGYDLRYQAMIDAALKE